MTGNIQIGKIIVIALCVMALGFISLYGFNTRLIAELEAENAVLRETVENLRKVREADAMCLKEYESLKREAGEHANAIREDLENFKSNSNELCDIDFVGELKRMLETGNCYPNGDN